MFACCSRIRMEWDDKHIYRHSTHIVATIQVYRNLDVFFLFLYCTTTTCTVRTSFLCGWTHIASATVPSKEQCDPTLANPTHPTNPVFQTCLDSSNTCLPCPHLHRGNGTVNDSCLFLFQSHRSLRQICTICHLKIFVVLVTAMATESMSGTY